MEPVCYRSRNPRPTSEALAPCKKEMEMNSISKTVIALFGLFYLVRGIGGLFQIPSFYMTYESVENDRNQILFFYRLLPDLFNIVAGIILIVTKDRIGKLICKVKTEVNIETEELKTALVCIVGIWGVLNSIPFLLDHIYQSTKMFETMSRFNDIYERGYGVFIHFIYKYDWFQGVSYLLMILVCLILVFKPKQITRKFMR